ncbi:MAG: type II toxin-antitoxin system Phd/YefM family antitoxin [Olsenella sp.]|nr:type II toxin-antitoxin system Phd/YefM family antitoxin [Olsenella sp.]
MPNTVPIRDLKDTASFAKMVENSDAPVIVTRNGYDAFVVMRSSDYDAMQEELAKAKLMQIVAGADRDFADGDYRDGNEFLMDIRKRYDL